MHKESLAMTEIRKIRDESSLRHSNMSKENIRAEHREVKKRFFEEMEKSVQNITNESRGELRVEENW